MVYTLYIIYNNRHTVYYNVSSSGLVNIEQAAQDYSGLVNKENRLPGIPVLVNTETGCPGFQWAGQH